MKRHFLTGLKAFAVSALALAAVSCYDDSELWGELEGLEQRVAALEEKLNSEVATLNSKIGAVETAYKAADADLLAKLTSLDAKLVAEVAKLAADLDAADGKLDGYASAEDLKAEIEKLSKDLNSKYTELKGVDTEILAALTKVAVTKVEKNAAGNAVLTFLDGTTLEVGAADANANNTGLVTVVDGKWAIVGADGKTTVLDALVHPDTELEFKVDPKSYEVFVSYDGEEWIATGVIVKDAQTINLVTGFVDAKDHVVITVGGVEYKLPKVSTNSFDIVSGMVFFAEGETKAIPVAMEGVVSSMVAKAPAGWTATLTDLGLNVTAPGTPADSGMDEDFGVLSEMNSEVTEDSGIIEMWVVTEDGKTIVGNLYVSLGDAYATISVSAEYEVTISIADDPYEGSPYKIFYGACKVSDFNPETLSAEMLMAGGPTDVSEGIYSNFVVGSGFQSAITVNIEDMLGEAPVIGTQYVVWAYPYEYAQYEQFDQVKSFVKSFVSPIKVTVNKPTLSFDDAILDISVEGAEKFYLGYYYGPKMYVGYAFNNLDYYKQEFGVSLVDYLLNGIQGQRQFYGNMFTDSYNGALTKVFESSYGFNPSEELTLLILPIVTGKSPFDYAVEDIVMEEIKLAGLTYGGTSTISFGEPTSKTYSSFALPISTTGKRVYYNFMTTEEYTALTTQIEEMESEDIFDVVSYYIEQDMLHYLNVGQDATFTAYMNTDPNTYSSLLPGVSYTVYAFSVDADGKCSTIYTKEVTTEDLKYSDDLGVAVEASSTDGTASASFTVTGNATKLYYRLCVASIAPDESEYKSEIIDALSGESYSWKTVYLDNNNLVEGVCSIANAGSVGNQNPRVILSFVEDADGNISEISKSTEFTNVVSAQN